MGGIRQWIKRTASGAVKRARSLKRPGFPRWLRIAFAWTVLVVGLAFIVGASMEFIASGKISKGVTIDGAGVGGMTRAAAKQVVREKVKPITTDVQLTFEGKSYPVSLQAISFRVDVDGMVQDAFFAGKRSPGVVRVFRRLFAMGVNKDVGVKVKYSRKKLTSAVRDIAESVNRDPVNASISVSTGAPVISPDVKGVKVKVEATVDAVAKALPTAGRTIPLVADLIQPQIVDGDISKIVLIRQKLFTLFLYDREKEVNSYEIAVGMPQYPTPNGRFHITYKEKNPTWLPTSEWAKDKQGIPQPPGPDNPLGGYWMDIGGGIGIHATPFPKTLGEQASHGCIRMAEDDAAALFNAVNVGTPVFITD